MALCKRQAKAVLNDLMRRDGYQAELAEMRPQAARNGAVATALR